MWFLVSGFLLIHLIILTVEDCREQEISIWYLAALGCGLPVYLLYLQMIKEVLIYYILGMLVGVTLLGVSWWTAEKIGYGDSVLLIILGGYLGIEKLVILLIIACFLCIVFSSIYGIIKKKTELPFLPFLLLGYMGILLIWS